MSVEAWEEVQRRGEGFADRLAQCLTGLTQINPSSFPWPKTHYSELLDIDFASQNCGVRDSVCAFDQRINGILDFGSKIGQAGLDFGDGLNLVVQQLFRKSPVPLRHEDEERMAVSARKDMGEKNRRANVGVSAGVKEELGSVIERLRNLGFSEDCTGSDKAAEEDDASGFNLRTISGLGRQKGTVNMTSSFDSRTSVMELSLAARGDLWRVEALRNGSSSLFLLQLGPLVMVQDSTLLLQVHQSKQHSLWYGYDRKTFADLQFPHGQLTYVSRWGLKTSAFIPFRGGLLQAEGHYPGETKFSYSCKNKWGTCITPMVCWPDKSFSLDLCQAIAKPTLQVSLCPTFGGSNPGMKAELIHSLGESVNVVCGCAVSAHPSAFVSLSLGRFKCNGNVGRMGIVLRADTPLSNVGRPSFSVRLNNALEF